MPTKIRSISMSHIGNLKLQVPLTLLIVAVAAIALVLTQTTTTNPTPAEAQSGGSEPKVSASRCGAASDLNGRIVKVADAIVYAINKDIAADNVQARRDHTSGPTPTLIPDIDMCSEVTATQIADIETLDLRGVDLTELRASDLAGLTSLTRLRLGNNSLTSLNQSTFSSLTTLTVLDLRKNNLTSLHRNLFQGLTNLESLGLGENRLSSLHEDIFDGLTNLEVLELDQTALTSLHEDIFDGLTNLEELQLDQTALTTLDEDIFDGLSNLETLNLSSNSFTSLHQDIFDGLSSLDDLALESNALTSLHEDIFDGLSSLSTLDISGNALTSLHANIFSDTNNLGYLYASNNQLTTLPASIFTGNSDLILTLTELVLDGNRISSLPELVFDNLETLEILSLSDNMLATLPNNIFNHIPDDPDYMVPGTSSELRPSDPDDQNNESNLDELYLDGNLLETLHAEIFDQLDYMTLLDLSGNNLAGDSQQTQLPTTIFDSTSLVWLDLSDNLLQTWPTLNTTLVSLFASNNSLGDLPSNLSSLTSLKTFHLYHNALAPSAVDPADFPAPFTNLKELLFGLADPTQNQRRDYITNRMTGLQTLKVQGPCAGRSTLEGRTQAVIDAIVDALPARASCSAVLKDDLDDITSLDLSGENITTLKGGEDATVRDFEGLTGLTSLDLSDNRLTTLTKEIDTGRNDDNNNDIFEYSTDFIFVDLESLETLNLCNNRITSWKEEATGVFAYLDELQTLRLCNNRITTLHDAMFDEVANLQTLDLSDNQITFLPETGVFATLSSLTTLNLQSNPLNVIQSSNVFNGLSNLETLHLKNTEIGTLDPAVLATLTSLQTFSVNHGAVEEQALRGQVPSLRNIEFEGAPPDPERTQAPGEPTFTPTIPATSTPIPAGRILRIKPSVESISIRAGSKVRLSVNIFGLQNEQDDSLAEKEEVTFEWSSSNGQGSFEESAPAGAETNGEPDDRKVLHTVSDIPGSYTVTATLGQGECRGTDEQCSASVKITVIRTIEREASATPVPCQISGTIPAAIPDSAGNQHSVFTPTDGGTFTDENVEVTAPINAVAGCEYIGIRVVESGSAVNRNNPLYRYTLAGMLYSVQAVDSSGAMITDYQFNRPIRVCVPLPGTLRGNISEIDALKVNSDGTLTSLTSKILSTPNGNPRVCGNLSELPADIAAGKRGAPDPTPEPMPTATPEPPETGGTAVPYTWVWLIAILGIGVFVLGAATLTRRRETATITTTPNTRT